MRKPLKEDSLAYWRPELIKEWDYKKNYPLTPYDVFKCSEKKTWWKCDRGHSWVSSVKTRYYKHGCPYCSNKKVCNDNCLATVNPKLAKEWHPTKNNELTPYDVTKSSAKKVWWKCPRKHEYQASMANRTSGCNCPYCSGVRVCNDNCLATVNFELAKEWNYKKNGTLTPYDVTFCSGKKVWWKCKECNCEWSALISDRKNGTGCPYCSGTKINNTNCLSIINPELAKEWNYKKNGKLMPQDVFINSKKKIWWKCFKCGYQWEAMVKERNKGLKKCFVCNSLALKNPNLAKEWNLTRNGKLTPCDVSINNNKKVWWRCEKGHEWEATVASRNKGIGCPYCSNQKINKDNCLSKINPNLSKERDYKKNKNITPDNVGANSCKRVFWKCKNGHQWETIIKDRNRGSGCPYCYKIELRDGTFWDSLPEAYYYLKLKKQKFDFQHHIDINLGKCNCDFYIPSANKYIEVTGYNEQWKHWGIYHKNILRKKKHITKKLKAKFEFVKESLTSKQTQYVRANAI